MSGAQGAGAGAAILQAVAGVLAAIVRVEGKVDLLIQHLGANRGATGNGAPRAGRVADVREIQGDKGDVKIRFDPRDWSGPSCKGLRASQCSADFLESYATVLDGFADNPKEGKDPKWDRLDAARCRRWAVEIREGRHRPDAPGDVPPPPGDTQWNRGNAPPPSNDGMGPPPDDLPPPPFGDDDTPF